MQATIKQEQGDGKVHDFRRVNENDGATYVVGLVIEGKNYRLTLDAAGRVMSKELDEEGKEEKPIAVESLPAAIKKTLSRESSGAPIVEVQIHAKTYTAEIKVVRKGLLTPALTATLAYAGTATRGADYPSLATSVVG